MPLGLKLASLFFCALIISQWAFSAEPHHKPQIDKLIELSRVYQSSGYRQQAINMLVEADELADASKQNETGLRLARLYFELGEYPLSLQLANRVLNHSPDAFTRASALNTLATVQSTLNTPKLASENFMAARQASNNDQISVTILINHLRHELDHGNKAVAESLSTNLIDSLNALDRNPEAIEARISAGDLLSRLSLLTEKKSYLASAKQNLQQAAKLSEQQNLSHLQSYALGHLGKILVDEGEYDSGLKKLRTASFLANANRSNESAYLWEWQIARAYRLQGNTQAAIEEYQNAIATLEKVRKELINGSPFTFPQKIQPLFSELSDLLLTAASETKSKGEQQLYLNQVQTVLEQSKSAELQDYFQNDCVIPDQTVDLNNVEVATAVIYPVVLSDRLEILVNVNQQVHQFVYDISSVELERLVNDFRDQLQRDQGDDEYKELGEELYAAVFAQAESVLKQNGIDTLLVIPDGILRTIPFSAIYDGNAFMVQKYAIATTPGISLTLPKQLDVAEASLFAGGISDAVQGFSGLPGVPVELQKLESVYGASVLQDQKFRRDTIQSQLASEDYSIVHIATHGHFDSNPQESFLLTYEDKLTMDLLEQSIGNRRLAGNPLELLVLSACETAAGDNRAALGLAGVALKAGARSAVATLWQISDAATVEIISTFYERSATNKETKAQALQHAQIQLIQSERFYHPTDWAPFLLIGNWL